jgi:hypothetical protein
VTFVSRKPGDGVGRAFYPSRSRRRPSPTGSRRAGGNVDLRGSQDRHLIVDRDEYLYELYSVWFDSAHNQWHAGSGAFWDMKTTAASRLDFGDAAGLRAPAGSGALRRAYNAYGTNLPEIAHAFA